MKIFLVIISVVLIFSFKGIGAEKNECLSKFYTTYFKSKECKLGMPMLIFAINFNHVEAAELLIKNGGADVNCCFMISEVVNRKSNSKLVTPLSLSIEKRYTSLISSLTHAGVNLEQEIDLPYPYNKRCKPLIFAIYLKDDAVIRLLIHAGANLNVQFESPAIHLAANFGMLDIVDKMLDYHADPHLLDSRGSSLLGSLRYFNSSDDTAINLINRLINLGVDPNHINKFSQSPLHIALSDNRPNLFMHLISVGTRADDKMNLWPNLYFTALEKDQLSIIEFLLSLGNNLNVVYPPSDFTASTWDRTMNQDRKSKQQILGHSLLGWSITSNHLDYAKLFLDHGGDVNFKDMYKDTPIFKTILFHNPSAVQLLLNYNVNLWLKDNNSRTPMELAAEVGDWVIYDLIINELSSK